MFGEVDKPRERHDGPAAPVGVGQRMSVWMSTWQGCEIGLAPDVRALLGNASNHVGKRYAAFQLVGLNSAADVTGRLKADARDPGTLLGKSDDSTYLAFVNARLDGAYQNGAHIRGPKRFDR